jgi:hypothetical protein
MTSINSLKPKSKKESLLDMGERFEQLQLDKKTNSPEFKMLKKLLEK